MTDLRSSAYHQAGHAVMSWLARVDIPPLSVVEGGRPAACAAAPHVKATGAQAVDQLFAWKEEREAAVRIILAGVMAQDIAASGQRTDFESESDFRKARKLVAEISATYAELIAYLQLLCVQTHHLLRANWASVEAVATVLLSRKSLAPRETAALILAANVDPRTAKPI